MIIIFLGTTGVHHALITANLYVNSKNCNHVFLAANFCDMSKDDIGYPIYIGTDDNDIKVYTLGVGHDVKMAEVTINNLREILGFNESKLLVFPVRIKGEWIINLVSKLPPFLGLGYIHSLIAKNLIKWQIDLINQHIDEVKSKVKLHLNDRS